MKDIKTITICSSVSFYKEVVDIKKELEEKGFTVLVPDLAEELAKIDSYADLEKNKQQDDGNPELKKGFIDAHISKIEQADAVLIVNHMKHSIAGYIGPNVLMEMTVAYYLKKPIYLLETPAKELPAYDEIMAMGVLYI